MFQKVPAEEDKNFTSRSTYPNKPSKIIFLVSVRISLTPTLLSSRPPAIVPSAPSLSP